MYKQKITAAAKGFVAGDDRYPRIKCRGMFPVGDGPSSNTVYNRTVPLRKVYKQLGSDGPICTDNEYPWLRDVAAVVNALQACYTFNKPMCKSV